MAIRRTRDLLKNMITVSGEGGWKKGGSVVCHGRPYRRSSMG